MANRNPSSNKRGFGGSGNRGRGSSSFRGGRSSNYRTTSTSNPKPAANSMNIEAYIRAGVLNVPADIWARIPRENYYMIEDQLSSLIMSDKMEFPLKVFYMKHPDELIIHKSGCILKESDYNSRGLIPSWMGGKIDIPYINRKGNPVAFFFNEGDYDRLDIITEWFTQYVRISACVRGKTIPSVAWKIQSKKIVREAISIATRTGKLGVSELGEAIYASGIKECNNFKVSVAMTVYNTFQPKIVYDMSSGWGDRAIAAGLSETVRVYVGTDPNHDLMLPYRQIKEYIESRNPKKSINIYNYGAELLPLEVIFGPPGDKRNPDLIFSSPPFFDYEDYSKAETQSISMFSTYQDWMNKWLVPTTINHLSYLKKGGHMVYHLGFIGEETPIGNDLITALKQVSGIEFRGIIPLFSSQQPKKRPIYFYVWKKSL